MSGGDEHQYHVRKIKNVQDLCKQSIALSDKSQHNTSESISEKDKKWLEEAISSLSVDITDKIKKSWDSLKNYMYKQEALSCDEFDDEFEMFIDLMENIDFSWIFFCLGGLNDIIKIIDFSENHKKYNNIEICLKILKTCFFNNEQCQNRANQEVGFNQKLLSMTCYYSDLKNQENLFFSCLDVLSAYVSGSKVVYLQLIDNPLMKKIVESITTRIIFHEKITGPKNNIIRFYDKILVLDPINCSRLFVSHCYLESLLNLIDSRLNSSSTTCPDPSLCLYLEFLITLLTSCNECGISLNNSQKDQIIEFNLKWMKTYSNNVLFDELFIKISEFKFT